MARIGGEGDLTPVSPQDRASIDEVKSAFGSWQGHVASFATVGSKEKRAYQTLDPAVREILDKVIDALKGTETTLSKGDLAKLHAALNPAAPRLAATDSAIAKTAAVRDLCRQADVTVGKAEGLFEKVARFEKFKEELLAGPETKLFSNLQTWVANNLQGKNSETASKLIREMEKKYPKIAKEALQVLLPNSRGTLN